MYHKVQRALQAAMDETGIESPFPTAVSLNAEVEPDTVGDLSPVVGKD